MMAVENVPLRLALVSARPLLFAVAAMAAMLVALGLLLPPSGEPRDLVNSMASPEEGATLLKSLTADERTALRAREREHLRRNPLDVRAIFNLAVLAELDGDTKTRDRFISEGARRSRRDAGTQLAALQLAANGGDFGRAAEILDGLLRARPELNQQVLPFASALAAREDGLDAIARLVAKGPPWRLPLLAFLAASDPSGGQAYQYLSGLAKRGVAPLDSELRAVLGPMIKNEDYAKAYFVWLDMLTPAELQKAGPVFDGGFELKSKGLFFDWTLGKAKNVKVEVKLRDGSATDKVLSVSLLDSRERFTGASQYLRLSPGPYELSAEAMTNGVQTSGGLTWRVSCIEKPALLGQSSVLRRDQPWEPFALSFAVPGNSCETQLLQLGPASPAAPDLVMSGQFFFDNFRISAR
jgi:hypothetical protein